jgi:hypothetical protein
LDDVDEEVLAAGAAMAKIRTAVAAFFMFLI